ncbi:MAG: hypothetical protein ACOX6W_01845 [Lentisphaeria bacterium]|jgi:hypothetical protein
MTDIPPFGAFITDPLRTHREYQLRENKQADIPLGDGRTLRIRIDNPVTQKPEKILTEEQLHMRRILGLATLFLALTICMICFLLDSL